MPSKSIKKFKNSKTQSTKIWIFEKGKMFSKDSFQKKQAAKKNFLNNHKNKRIFFGI